MSRGLELAGGAWARYVLLLCTVALTGLGLVMIYSASSITAAAREGSSEHYLLRQMLFVAFGGLVAAVIARSDYRRLKNGARAVWWASLGLLVLTLMIGAVRKGARRWISLGLFSVQPSELAKVACILAVAAVAIDWRKGRVSDGSFAGRVLALTLVPGALIALQRDLGTLVTLCCAVAFVLVLAGVRWRWLALAGAAVLGVVAALIALEPYRLRRLIAFTDPFADPLGKGYQTVQALYAFGSGGVDGVGLGLSRQKFFYLPEAHTDFILAIIGEEAGLIGTLAVVAAFALLVWAGFRIAVGARDPYGRLVAGAATGTLGFQALLNMAAVTGLLPVTGKPLPFLSYGGSSMLVSMILLGLVLSVSRYGALAPRAVRSRPRTPGEEVVVRARAAHGGRHSRARVPGPEPRRAPRRAR